MHINLATLFIFGLAAQQVVAQVEAPNDENLAPNLAPRSFPVYSYSADVNSYMIGRGTYVPSSSAGGGYYSSSAAGGGYYSSSAGGGYYSSQGGYYSSAGQSYNANPNQPRPSNRPQNNNNPRPSNRPNRPQQNNNNPSSSVQPPSSDPNGAAGLSSLSMGALIGLGALTGVIAVVL